MPIAFPRQHIKVKNAKKPRLTPKQCREVTGQWKSCLGADQAKVLVGKYTNPTRQPSTKDIARHVQNNLAHCLHRDRSVSSAHLGAAGRRNPGRNDGSTWNGDSFICTGQIDVHSDYSDFDPFAELCPICEDEYNREAQNRRPRTVEISLADVPMKVRKPKQRKAHGYEILPPVTGVSSVPQSELGEPSSSHDPETVSNFSWDAMASDDLSVFSEVDWEDLESPHAHDTLHYELGQELQHLQLDSDFPPVTLQQRSYAQALSEQFGERQG